MPTSPRACPIPAPSRPSRSTYETVKIYDRTGQHLLYESIDPRPFRGDRTYLPIDQIPEMVRDATIALEDRTFYTNIGVNVQGIGRGSALQPPRPERPGRQLDHPAAGQERPDRSRERYQVSYARKIKEAIMAIEITRKYPGKRARIRSWSGTSTTTSTATLAYGVEAAARVYYDKSVADLTLDEIAVLAAIPQYPGLNPIQAPADAYRRQRKVLTAMQEAGYLTQEQVDAAKRYFNTRLLNDLVKGGLLSADRSAAGGDRRQARHRPGAQRAGQGRPAHPERSRRSQEAAGPTVAVRARDRPKSALRCRPTRRTSPSTCCSSCSRNTTRPRTPTSSGRTA